MYCYCGIVERSDPPIIGYVDHPKTLLCCIAGVNEWAVFYCRYQVGATSALFWWPSFLVPVFLALWILIGGTCNLFYTSSARLNGNGRRNTAARNALCWDAVHRAPKPMVPFLDWVDYLLWCLILNPAFDVTWVADSVHARFAHKVDFVFPNIVSTNVAPKFDGF